jgi:hypothetical protein
VEVAGEGALGEDEQVGFGGGDQRLDLREAGLQVTAEKRGGGGEDRHDNSISCPSGRPNGRTAINGPAAFGL